jgi:hypothetical protein
MGGYTLELSCEVLSALIMGISLYIRILCLPVSFLSLSLVRSLDSTTNNCQSQGLSVFPKELYDVVPYAEADGRPGHCLMLRSHKLQESEVAPSIRAIARCGAGTNNIPVPRMTQLGIPVFNTPGANANAVKGASVLTFIES